MQNAKPFHPLMHKQSPWYAVNKCEAMHVRYSARILTSWRTGDRLGCCSIVAPRQVPHSFHAPESKTHLLLTSC